MSINRKMRRKAQKIKPDECIRETIIKTVAIAAEVVHENWGKMKNKEQRINVFVNLFIDGLPKIEEPSPLRREIEEELRKMVIV